MAQILWTQYSVLQRDEFFYRHLKHEDWTVYIVIDGAFRCTVEGVTDTVNKGDIYVIPPNADIDRTVLEPLTVHFLHFQPEHTAIPPIPVGKLHLRNTTRKEQTIQLLENTPNLPADQQEIYRIHCLEDLFLQYSYEKTEQAFLPQDKTVKKILECIRKEYAFPLRMGDLSARFGLSPSGMIKKFQRTVGKSPQRYLIEFRIRCAKEFLVDTSMNISEIADRTGFENVYYFSKAFKKETGISPSEYRKNYLI